jgi:hypothetical protein
MHIQSLAWLPRRRVSQLKISDPIEQIVQCDPCFQSRKRRPKAGVNPVAERQMTVRLAGNVELFGIRKLFGVAIGRADHMQNEWTCWKRLPMQFNRTPRSPHEPLQRRSKA